jgi:hypothetical protein
MLRIPHCLDNRLIDGGKVVSLIVVIIIFIVLLERSDQGG